MHIESLLPYYEAELSALREQGRLFAEKYPSVAEGLGLSATHCDDPHIERLLEGVAYLGARVQHRINRALPTLAQALLTLRYPDWLASVPSSSILQIQSSDEKISGRSLTVPQGAEFRRHVSEHGELVLRTAWPIEVSGSHVAACELIDVQRSVDWQRRCPKANYALRLTLKLKGTDQHTLDVWISGDNTQAWQWWDCLSHQSQDVWCQRNEYWINTKQPITLGGLSQNKAMPLWPRDPRTPALHALLVDYFALPEAYRFIRIPLPTQKEPVLELCIPLSLTQESELIDKAQSALSARMFKTNCVAASNWTAVAAEPIRLSYTQADYSLRPNQKHLQGLVIHKVQDVHYTALSSESQTPEHQRVEPFLSVHAIDSTSSTEPPARWHAFQYGNTNIDHMTWRIALVNNRFEPNTEGIETIGANLICTQGSMVRNAQVQESTTNDHWQLRQAGMKVKAALTSRVSAYTAAKDADESVWQLLATSTIELNQLIQRDAKLLRQLLSALNRHQDSSAQQRINHIDHIESRSEWVPMSGKPSVIWINGIDVVLRTTVVHDHGHSVLCWCLMLDRLFGSLCPVQQAVRLTVESKDGKSLYRGQWRVSAWNTLDE
jgi:type VI secretion system protein ImpG